MRGSSIFDFLAALCAAAFVLLVWYLTSETEAEAARLLDHTRHSQRTHITLNGAPYIRYTLNHS